MNKLWTRDFKIITFGTIISMLGNSVSGFAIGLLVLDYTGSTFLYALFMVIYSLPKIIMPLLAGPYLDKFSRKKVIYGLDFLSAGLYSLLFFLLLQGAFNYFILLLICLFLGSIDSIYMVAYDSLYPTLVSEGNFSKAYSISSMIYPLAAFMVPVAALVYETIGIAPLFLFNALSFLIAAIFETQIKANETHINKHTEKFTFSRYISDFKEGISYIKIEKGLLAITLYFSLNMLAFSATNTVVLPYFKNTPWLGVQLFTYVMGCGVIGRLIGGMVHYKYKYPIHKKFTIALSVYLALSFLDGFYLFTPVPIMMIACFISGLLGVTSYNIRISATQKYVPDAKRGRFNGTFQMAITLGSMTGQLIAGGLAEYIGERYIIAAFMAINALAALLIMFRNRSHVKPIYNQQA